MGNFFGKRNSDKKNNQGQNSTDNSQKQDNVESADIAKRSNADHLENSNSIPTTSYKPTPETNKETTQTKEKAKAQPPEEVTIAADSKNESTATIISSTTIESNLDKTTQELPEKATLLSKEQNQSVLSTPIVSPTEKIASAATHETPMSPVKIEEKTDPSIEQQKPKHGNTENYLSASTKEEQKKNKVDFSGKKNENEQQLPASKEAEQDSTAEGQCQSGSDQSTFSTEKRNEIPLKEQNISPESTTRESNDVLLKQQELSSEQQVKQENIPSETKGEQQSIPPSETKKEKQSLPPSEESSIGRQEKNNNLPPDEDTLKLIQAEFQRGLEFGVKKHKELLNALIDTKLPFSEAQLNKYHEDNKQLVLKSFELAFEPILKLDHESVKNIFEERKKRLQSTIRQQLLVNQRKHEITIEKIVQTVKGCTNEADSHYNGLMKNFDFSQKNRENFETYENQCKEAAIEKFNELVQKKGIETADFWLIELEAKLGENKNSFLENFNDDENKKKENEHENENNEETEEPVEPASTLPALRQENSGNTVSVEEKSDSSKAPGADTRTNDFATSSSSNMDNDATSDANSDKIISGSTDDTTRSKNDLKYNITTETTKSDTLVAPKWGTQAFMTGQEDLSDEDCKSDSKTSPQTFESTKVADKPDILAERKMLKTGEEVPGSTELDESKTNLPAVRQDSKSTPTGDNDSEPATVSSDSQLPSVLATTNPNVELPVERREEIKDEQT